MFVLFLQFKERQSWFGIISLQVFHVIDNNQLLLLRIGRDGRILERFVDVWIWRKISSDPGLNTPELLILNIWALWANHWDKSCIQKWNWPKIYPRRLPHLDLGSLAAVPKRLLEVVLLLIIHCCCLLDNSFNFWEVLFSKTFSQAGKEAGERAKGRLVSTNFVKSSERQIIALQGEEKMEEGGDWRP